MSNDSSEEEEQQIAQNTELARGPYAAFFERNKSGIQYVNVETRTYFISRGWTLCGPIPAGIRIEHTGLDGYGRSQNIYNADGSKKYPRGRSGGSHSKGPLWRRRG